MPDIVSSENSIMLINDFKVKWFSLVSRIDAAPTIDEMVLTSFNCIASLLINNRPRLPGYDLLFDVATKLGVFESVFRWNFNLCGDDLQEYKAKELQFYDSLITSEGSYYLRYPEFTIPLVATLHLCSVRSCLPVERVLVRTLNTVCAALCCQPASLKVFTLSNGRDDEQATSKCNYNQLSASSRFIFRRLCMGLFDRPSLLSDMEQYSESECYLDAIPEQGYEKTAAHSPNWILPPSVNPKPLRNCTSNQLQTAGSDGETLSFRPRIIDSLFDLLVPFVYREGDLGWQARDSLLLLAAYSTKDDEFSRNVVQHSTLCQVLATGLSTFYANLPHRLAKSNHTSQWPSVMILLEECELRSWQFAQFFDALHFCRSVLEVSHPLIQSSLLYYIHSGFFELVIGQSLVQSNVEEVITATIYLERLLSHSVGSPLLPTLLRFLLSPLPTEYEVIRGGDAADGHTKETSVVNGNDAAGDECPKEPLANSAQSHGYMDLLISRLHCCNTLLGIATLSLFNTILGLNCEDMMVYLVLRYLVPFRDKLLSIGWTWPDAVAFRNASEFFTKLTQPNDLAGTECAAATTLAQAPSSASTSALQAATSLPSNANGSADANWQTEKGLTDSWLSRESQRSVAELHVDDDVGSWTNASSVDPLADGSSSNSRSSINQSKASRTAKNALSHHPIETLMPVPLASNDSVVMTGIPAPYSPEFNDSHLQLKERHPRGNSATKNSNNLVNGVPDKQCDSPPPPPASPDDWLAYAAWARSAVESRQTACANWRLTFDRHRPMAHQLAAHDLLAGLSWGDEPVIDRGQQTPADPDGGDDDEEVEDVEKRFTNGEDMGYIDTEFYEEGERLVSTKMVDTVASFVETAAELNSEEEFRLPRVEHVRNGSDINITNESCNKSDSKLGGFQSPLTPSGTEDNAQSSLGQPSVSRIRRQSRRSRQISDSANDLDPALEADVAPSMRCFSDTNKVKSWYCLSYVDCDLGDINTEVADDSTAVAIPSRCANLRLSSSSRTQPTHGKLPRSISLSDSAVQNVILNSHRNELDLFVTSLCSIDCPVGDVHDKDGSKPVDYDQYFDVFMNGSESPTRPTDTSLLLDNQATQISFKSGSQWSDVDLYQNNSSGNDTDEPGAEICHADPVDSLQNESQHLWLINSFLSGAEYSLAGGENVAAVRSAEVFLERLARRSLGEANESQKCSPVPTAQIDCAVEAVVFPDLGPFLTTLLTRIEGMSRNCFYANLYLTNLITHLVAYPVPLLRAILLLVPSAAAAPSAHSSPAPTLSPGVEVGWLTEAEESGFTAKCLKEASGQLLQTALGSVRQTLDRYAAQLARQPEPGLPSFRDLVLDARRYFRNSVELESRVVDSSSDQSYSMINQARAGSLIQEQRASAQPVKNNKQRLSILRRLFKRIWPQQSATSKKEPSSSLNSKDEKVRVSSFQIHHMLHNQPSIHESWSQFKWLPEVSEADIPSKLTKRLSFSKTVKKGQRKNSGSITGSRRDSATLTSPTEEFSINWHTTQRMVLCAVVLEEFSKELSALSMEHSVRCCS